jgi:hypothetical protein
MRHFALAPLAVTLAVSAPEAAHATPTLDSLSIFASGGAIGATGPDSVTAGNGSVWVEYGNGADSTGLSGNSTIVQYNARNGAIQNQYTISGLVDGLKIDPTSGLVWALQNNDGNSTLSLINPATHAVTGPLSYGPPYVGALGRGYDDVAFDGSKVFLSFTNPASPTDPVAQQLNQGHNPAGTLTTTDVLQNQQTGTNSDSDSLKTRPNGDLVLTSEGDGPGSGSNGVITLISNPGAASQSVTNVVVTDGHGNNVKGMDDVLFPSATSGVLFFTDSANNDVYEAVVSGLDPNTPIASLASFGELGLVNLATGVATPFITGADVPGGVLSSPHGIDFIPTAVPEPPSLVLLGAALGAVTAFRRRVAYKEPVGRKQRVWGRSHAR